MSPRTVAELIEHQEGRKARLYQDTEGKWSVGVGRCLETKPLRDFEIDFLRDNDIRDADHACIAIFGATGFASFAPARQAALVSMVFQLGETGLRAFVGMRAAIDRGNWAEAASCALDSRWARQTPERAQMNADMLRSGAWPDHVS